MSGAEPTALPNRRHPVHPPLVERMHSPTILLVTVCTRNRRPILARRETMEAMTEAWREAEAWTVGRFVIMPDHAHLFCQPARHSAESVRDWVGFWKRRASRRQPDLKGVWLPDCWDTQMRSYAHYVEKTAYVRLNPVRRGLARTEDEWPFQGVVNVFEWR